MLRTFAGRYWLRLIAPWTLALAVLLQLAYGPLVNTSLALVLSWIGTGSVAVVSAARKASKLRLQIAEDTDGHFAHALKRQILERYAVLALGLLVSMFLGPMAKNGYVALIIIGGYAMGYFAYRTFGYVLGYLYVPN
jgi:hypothetical protein